MGLILLPVSKWNMEVIVSFFLVVLNLVYFSTYYWCKEIAICSIHFPFFGVRQNVRTVNDVFPQVHKGENGLKNPYFAISRRRRRREIVKGFERPFSPEWTWGKTSFTVRRFCRTSKKRDKWIEQITFLNFTSVFV